MRSTTPTATTIVAIGRRFAAQLPLMHSPVLWVRSYPMFAPYRPYLAKQAPVQIKRIPRRKRCWCERLKPLMSCKAYSLVGNVADTTAALALVLNTPRACASICKDPQRYKVHQFPIQIFWGSGKILLTKHLDCSAIFSSIQKERTDSVYLLPIAKTMNEQGQLQSVPQCEFATDFLQPAMAGCSNHCAFQMSLRDQAER